MFAPRTGPATGPGLAVRLTSSQESAFGFTPGQAREWESLESESDPFLLAEDLLRFAQSLESKNQIEAAASIYALFLEDAQALPQREEARRRLESLRGRGPEGRRLERELQRFVSQATDPSWLFGMTTAGLAFQTLRCATLANLLSTPEVNLFTRGTGASLTASALGFAVEVPTLVLTNRGISALLGRSDFQNSFSQDVAQSGIQLFFLKSTGAASGRFFPSPSVRQAGMLGGLWLAHSVEVALAWKPEQAADSLLVDSLLTLGQFQIGLAWSRSLLGPEVDALWRELEWRACPRDSSGLKAVTWETIPISGREFHGFDPGPRPFDSILMNSRFSESQGESLSETKRFRGRLATALEQPAESESVEQLAESIGKIPDPVKTAYSDLLLESLPRVWQGSEAPVVERMVLGATARFAYVEELNPLRRASGSFYDSLVQEFFERSLAERDGRALGTLIRTVSGPGDVTTLEKIFRRQGWQVRYGLGIFTEAAGETLPRNWERVLQAIPALGPSEAQRGDFEFVRRMIGDFLRAYHAEKIPEEWKNVAHNYLSASFGEGSLVRQPMGLPILARGLQHFSELVRSDPAWGGVFFKITETASKSPVPLLYFDRLFKLLATDGPIEKIGDLAFPSSFNLAELRLRLVDAAGLTNPKRAGELIDGRFETGFVTDLTFARKLARFYEELPHLLDRGAAARRRNSFHEQAKHLLLARARANLEVGLGKTAPNFLPVDFMDLLEVHSTATSRHAREAFLRGQLELQLLSYTEMQSLWARQAQSAVSKAPALSLFLPEEKSPTGRPLVALTETSPLAPFEEKARRALLQVGLAVHEYEHFSHHRELPFQHPEGLLRAEMRASLEELHFLLKNGELSEWEKIRPLVGQGLGIYLRSRIEQDYLGEPRLLSISGR